MATITSTTRRGVLAILGSTPALAIPVDARPTSRADAVAQFEAATRRLDEADRAFGRAHAQHERGRAAAALVDRAEAAVADAFTRFLTMPAPTIGALAAKIEMIARHDDLDESVRYLVADARRLAGVQ